MNLHSRAAREAVRLALLETEPAAVTDATLATGHAGYALLLSEIELGTSRRLAHAHLEQAVSALPAAPGLMTGVAGAAFAALQLNRRHTDYATLLQHLDTWLHEAARHLIQACDQQRASSPPQLRMSTYDTVSGLCGLGAYLLRRCRPSCQDLRAVLSCLTRLAPQPAGENLPSPGWWITGPPSPDSPPAYHNGHANLGLAHGIAGPLALLSLAHRRGMNVPGHLDAISSIARWLIARRVNSSQRHAWWPSHLTAAQEAGKETLDSAPTQLAWCNATPGISRALQLASLAVQRPDWNTLAVSTFLSAMAVPHLRQAVNSPSVCHGWAGLLQITTRLRQDCHGPTAHQRLTRLARLLAERTLSTAQDHTPEASGLLFGPTGVALALHSYAYPSRHGDWDAALLLA
ncbi:lanthionine synthetase C family protein [Streptomyces sp. NPDC093097]|uniref:lanthionine synthetase C family protein n=1 Tax=Streptomyces sp. NPDC093097 TaxID=3366027 RepID=UPI00381AC6B7